MNNFYLDREKLISYLKELAKNLRKNKSQKCELIIVGGGSILTKYSKKSPIVHNDYITSRWGMNCSNNFNKFITYKTYRANASK